MISTVQRYCVRGFKNAHKSGQSVQLMNNLMYSLRSGDIILEKNLSENKWEVYQHIYYSTNWESGRVQLHYVCSMWSEDWLGQGRGYHNVSYKSYVWNWSSHEILLWVSYCSLSQYNTKLNQFLHKHKTHLVLIVRCYQNLNCFGVHRNTYSYKVEW